MFFDAIILAINNHMPYLFSAIIYIAAIIAGLICLVLGVSIVLKMINPYGPQLYEIEAAERRKRNNDYWKNRIKRAGL